MLHGPAKSAGQNSRKFFAEGPCVHRCLRTCCAISPVGLGMCSVFCGFESYPDLGFNSNCNSPAPTATAIVLQLGPRWEPSLVAGQIRAIEGASDCYDEPEGNSMVNSRFTARELHCNSMLDVRRNMRRPMYSRKVILSITEATRNPDW